MAESDSDQINAIEKQRAYLALLAQMQIDPRLKGKVDLSGVVQQTILEAVQNLSHAQFENSEMRLAWLREILGRNLIDAVRHATSQKRNALRERSMEQSLEQSSIRLQNFAVASGSSPSMHLKREELAARLAEALAELLPDEREAVVMRHVQEMPLEQIAEQLGRTKAAVAGLLKRGLKKLRENSNRFAD